MKHKPSHLKAVLFLVIASILWSTGGVLIKGVNWHPIAIAAMRSGISALLILVYCRKMDLKLTRYIAYGAICYTFTVILFVTANKMTTSANAILLQFTAPIWVALLSGWLLKEAVKIKDWILIAVVFAGMGLFFIESLSPGALVGNLLAIVSGVFLAGVVLFLRLNQNHEPVLIALYGNVLTFIVGLPWIFSHWSVLTPASFQGLLLLGVFQLGLSYILFSESLKTVTALEGILIPVIEPLLNPLWVFLFTAEKPSYMALVGGAVVIVAVTLRSLDGVLTSGARKVRLKEESL